MPRSIVHALAAMVLVAGAFQACPAHSQGRQPDISPALRKPFLAAREAQTAKRWSEVVAKSQEILATAGRKPDDTFYAYLLLYQAYGALGNAAEERKALQGMAESGWASAADQALYFKKLMTMSFEARDYDGAIGFGTRLINSNFADSSVYTMVGQSHFVKGDYASTARFFKNLVDAQVKRGETPREANLEMMRASYEKLGDKAGATNTLEKLVVYYPKPGYWEALLYSVRNSPALQNSQRLFVFRLMQATNTLKLRQDYSKFAELATRIPLPAEAQKVFEAGLKSGVFPASEKPTAERRMERAARDAAAERAALARLEAEAAAAPAGSKDVLLGMIRYSHGEAEQAIAVLQRGIGKGGLQPDQQVEAGLMLGIAQLRVRDKAGAQKTFGAIRTTDPDWQRIVRFWTLYAK